MGDAGARLCIDYGYMSAQAVLRTVDGRVVTLLVDGSPVLPTGVAVDSDGALHPGRAGVDLGTQRPDLYVRIPGQRLGEERLRVGDQEVDPVDLAAATLGLWEVQARQLAGAPVTDVVIATPSGWGPRKELQIRKAARRAGLGQARLLDTSEAIVRDALARGILVPAGAAVLVCRVDPTVGAVAVLRRGVDGFEQVAAFDVGELGEVAGSTVPDQVVTAARTALAELDIDGTDVGAVFCQGPSAVMAGLASALQAQLGLAVVPVLVAETAAAVGGLHDTVPTRAVRTRWPYAKLAYGLLTVVTCAGGAAFLIAQILHGTNYYAATSISPEMVITPWAAWALVVVYATLALVALTLLGSDLRRLRHDDEASNPTRPDARGGNARLGSSLLFAAGVAIAVAAVWGLFGAAEYEVDPTPFLSWTLTATVPLAGLIAVHGWLLPRAADAVRARDRLRFPPDALAVAVVSSVSLFGAYTGFPFDSSRELWWWMEHLGAAGIGVAIGLLVTPPGRRRIVVAALLGWVGTFTISLDTADTVGAILIGAIVVWWLVRATTAALPLLRGMLTTNPPPDPQPQPPPGS